MDIKIYQVDAFTNHMFGGNPAAVCPLDSWLDDETLLNIAIENNLSETAFIVPMSGEEFDYQLRWFTPAVEVDLCGHATVATAAVLFEKLGFEGDVIRFKSLSGLLTVTKVDGKYELDFPVLTPEKEQPFEGLADVMGAAPLEFYRGSRDHLLVYPDADTVLNLKPDFTRLKGYGLWGYIATAPGNEGEDFISRCFFPAYNIDEDPVTGSAHCVSGPYWAKRLGKDALFARQRSARGGDLWLKVMGERIKIAGEAVLVMEGTLYL